MLKLKKLQIKWILYEKKNAYSDWNDDTVNKNDYVRQKGNCINFRWNEIRHTHKIYINIYIHTHNVHTYIYTNTEKNNGTGKKEEKPIELPKC